MILAPLESSLTGTIVLRGSRTEKTSQTKARSNVGASFSSSTVTKQTRVVKDNNGVGGPGAYDLRRFYNYGDHGPEYELGQRRPERTE